MVYLKEILFTSTIHMFFRFYVHQIKIRQSWSLWFLQKEPLLGSVFHFQG